MKRVVVNADDLGICEATNEAVAQAYRHGIVTSASLMANGPALEHAVREVVRPNPGLGVGLHLCLTGGPCVAAADRIPLLVDRDGRFRRGFASLCLLVALRRHSALEQIEIELEAQFARIREMGVEIDHVDGHRHFHMIPAIFAVVARLARRHGCPAIRVSHEPLLHPRYIFQVSRWPTWIRNLPKKLLLSYFARQNVPHVHGLVHPERVFGIMDSGRMDRTTFRRVLPSAGRELTEIIVHPGSCDPLIDRSIETEDVSFLASPDRNTELLTLQSDDVRRLVELNHVSLLSFGQVHSRSCTENVLCSPVSEPCSG